MNDYNKAAQLIHNADAIIVAAGAGIGADSGLPTFRSQDGFWREYPALKSAGLDFTDIASPGNFNTRPKLAWGFYGHRLELYRKTQPHHGFTILQQWRDKYSKPLYAYTTNVDGHFQKAGIPETHVVEIHGSIQWLQCMNCRDEIWRADGFIPQVDNEHCLLTNEVPRCPLCGTIARPNILMFDDFNWASARTSAQKRAFTAWQHAIRSFVVIEIGAGTDIPSILRFSGHMAERGASLIRINPDDSPLYESLAPPAEKFVRISVGALTALQGINDAM